MTLYVINTKQLMSSVATIALMVASCVWLVHIFLAYLDTPDVYVTDDGKCVKVINYRNGDGYTCNDKDVVLRKYSIVHVQ